MGFNKAHKMAQRLHRERRQPEHRKKFGYLEKKQDYKKRALDHHTKAERIKKLKNKAQQRNPNEFTFHMINARIVDGIHQETLRPMEPNLRERLIKKEELVKRYNQRLMQARREKRRLNGELNHADDDDGHGHSGTNTNKIRKPKHIIFNN